MLYISKRSSSVLSALILAALLSAATGCGQNPFVTGSDSKKHKATENQSSSLQSAVPTPVPTPTPSPSPSPSPTPSPTPEPKVITVIDAAPKEKPPAVLIRGKDGKNGRNGKDACVEYGKTENFEIQAVPPAEIMAYRKSQFVDLPYLPTSESVKKFTSDKIAAGAKDPLVSVTLLTTNQGNAMSGQKSADGSIRKDSIDKNGIVIQSYVQDSMVVFDVPLKLPARRRILNKELFAAVIHLSLYKHSVDNINDSESLCSLDFQTCSGAPFHKDMIWGDLRNPKFNPNAFSNTFFSQNLDAAIKMSGNTEWRDQLHIDLLQMLSPNGQRLTTEQFLDMMYGKDMDPNQPLIRNLRFVISDDTRVNNTPAEKSYLEFKYAHNGCKADGTPDLTPADAKDIESDMEQESESEGEQE